MAIDASGLRLPCSVCGSEVHTAATCDVPPLTAFLYGRQGGQKEAHEAGWKAGYEKGHEDTRAAAHQFEAPHGLALAGQRPAASPTQSPLELATFAESCKALGMRTAKGEFVASDGTRMPYDWAFEPKQKKGREDV